MSQPLANPNPLGRLADLMEDAWRTYLPPNYRPESPAGRDARRLAGAQLQAQAVRLAGEAARAFVGRPNGEHEALSGALRLLRQLFSANPPLLGDWIRAVADLRRLALAEPARKADPGDDYDQEFLGLRAIARLFGVDYGLLRGRAEAWRKQQKAPGFNYRKDTLRQKGQSEYTYQVGALRPIIDELKKSAADT
jgi:hypothetical protein